MWTPFATLAFRQPWLLSTLGGQYGEWPKIIQDEKAPEEDGGGACIVCEYLPRRGRDAKEPGLFENCVKEDV